MCLITRGTHHAGIIYCVPRVSCCESPAAFFAPVTTQTRLCFSTQFRCPATLSVSLTPRQHRPSADFTAHASDRELSWNCVTHTHTHGRTHWHMHMPHLNTHKQTLCVNINTLKCVLWDIYQSVLFSRPVRARRGSLEAFRF